MATNEESSRHQNGPGRTTNHDAMYQQIMHSKSISKKKPKIDPRNALLLTDPLVDRENLINDKGQRFSGAFGWIRENQAYKNWLEARRQCLWVSGGPGTGKTALSIFLTEELQSQFDWNRTSIFFFCDKGDKNRNNAISVLRGLSYQLLTKYPRISARVSSFFDTPKQTENTLSSPDILWIVLKTLLSAPGVGSVFCVLDGLDECDDESIENLVNRFHDFYSQPQQARSTTRRFNLVVVSRNISGLDIYPQVQLRHDNNNHKTNNRSTLTSAALNLPTRTGAPASTQSISTTLPKLSQSNNEPPRLVHASTMAHSPSLYITKAVINFKGNPKTMAQDWSEEEWTNHRRVVMFEKTQKGAIISLSFRAVSVDKRPANSTCISCIWWAEKSETYVTFVDILLLFEMLLALPGQRIHAPEKNRLRRHLEGFHPSTIDKTKPDTKDFFKLVMSFPPPRPRNIGNRFKVIPWSVFEPAIKKVVGKYCAAPGPYGHNVGSVTMVSIPQLVKVL
ncbi:hypothetical protein GGI35DRAFT_439591 [Trichoderma velutinum]